MVFLLFVSFYHVLFCSISQNAKKARGLWKIHSPLDGSECRCFPAADFQRHLVALLLGDESLFVENPVIVGQPELSCQVPPLLCLLLGQGLSSSRRKKFRSAASPPNGEDFVRSIPFSSPHRKRFAGLRRGPHWVCLPIFPGLYCCRIFHIVCCWVCSSPWSSAL